MAQYQLLLLFLISGAAYVSVTMADDMAHQTLEQSTLPSLSSNPAPSPSPSITRKLGKHNPSKTNPKSSDAPALSPRSAPISPTSETPETEESVSILGQEIHLKKHHHSMDKSVAGGGVILGGLATTFLVAVFCYIRATARHKGSKTSTTGSSP